MHLESTGHLGLVPAALAAIALASFAAWLTHRNVTSGSRFSRLSIIGLRFTVTFLLIVTLAGPTVQWGSRSSVKPDVLVFVDVSDSMTLTDTQTPSSIKRKILRSVGRSNDPIETYNELTRLQRAELILAYSPKSLIAELRDRFRIHVHTTQPQARQVRWSTDAGTFPNLRTDRSIPTTDFVTPIIASLRNDHIDPTAIILISDGCHNHSSPVSELTEYAKQSDVPVHTIGIGSDRWPHDIAAVSVDTPTRVYHKDRIQGELAIHDHMPAGKTFDVIIRRDDDNDDKIVFSQAFQSEGSGRRHLPFTFELDAVDEDSTHQLIAQVSPLPDEAHADNNQVSFQLQTVSKRNRVLIIDHRPRWEYRYVRNLLDRDPNWEVTSLLTRYDSDGSPIPWESTKRRNTRQGDSSFPSTVEQLAEFKLIILGDVPNSQLPANAPDLIAEFVADHSGGVILIDGHNGHLDSWTKTDLAPLIPIERTASANRISPTQLSLTPDGIADTALRIRADKRLNQSLWQALPPPKSIAPTVTKPGAETLVTAIDKEGSIYPAMVLRRFGSGLVIYQAFDESWRWRKHVLDDVHTQYWNQVAERAIKPMDNTDKTPIQFVGDQARYYAGDTANFDISISDDAHAKSIGDTLPLAVTHASMKPFKVQARRSVDGTYQAQILFPRSGEFDISVIGSEGSPTEHVHRIEILEPDQLEFRRLARDRSALESIAKQSGGRYVGEEDARAIGDHLISESRSAESLTTAVIWSDWRWFALIMTCLAIEWTLRKFRSSVIR